MWKANNTGMSTHISGENKKYELKVDRFMTVLDATTFR